MNVKIIVDAKIHGGNPSIDLYSRHYNKLKYHTNPNTFLLKPGIQTLECDIDFYPVDCLNIKFTGKVHTVPDTFVKLNKVIIDEIDMQQFLLQGKYFPMYDENFYNEFTPEDFYCPGTDFYHNGVFELQIKTPIWKFMMEKYNVS